MPTRPQVQKIITEIGFVVTSSDDALPIVADLAERLSQSHLQQMIDHFQTKIVPVTTEPTKGSDDGDNHKPAE